MKVFVFDASQCNGCYGCQIACKDEHCEQEWEGYAAAQPLTGQFWCKIDEKEMGKTPFVHVNYKFTICNHCDDCKLLAAVDDDTVYRRDDGFVVIDPVKAKGRKDLADLCDHVFWNAELELPQKCTGCAHLIDDGWEEPRCVDYCPTEALKFVEESEAQEMGAVASHPGSHLYYMNMPKRRICGTVADRTINEVIIGAKVEIVDAQGNVVDTIETDPLGDFIYKNADEGEYKVRISCKDYKPVIRSVSTVDNDGIVGEVLLQK
ncbi:MAG: 4Fe-4S dicluster domain-containing protein [Coriobacteriales bacterium]|jgi:Fe-S-cluster-containing dehydrogenase component